MAKVSVIVPIYGVEKYLRECLDSILNQSLSDLEIILIDDGSKDKCPEIIDEYAKKDNRIIAIHKENGGYGSAMNVGLEKTTGEYIGIVEPDDYIESKMYTSNAYYYWRRINYNESDDLKDYTIPFKRSDEIHKWLHENNIDDENILVNLYKRELAYINIVLGIKNLTNKQDCYSRIKNMLQRIKLKTVLTNTQFKKAEKKQYLQAIKNLDMLRFKILFKQIRKNIIRIRISSKESYILLFGKSIIRRNYGT